MKNLIIIYQAQRDTTTLRSTKALCFLSKDEAFSGFTFIYY